MANYGRYEKIPDPESIAVWLKFVRGKDFIIDVEHVSHQIYDIRRYRKSDLRVFLTNVYIVGVADIYEILGEDSTINAIVTISAWNSYTGEAKQFCCKQNIGLFKFKEFFGAIYYSGKRFVNYTPPKPSL